MSSKKYYSSHRHSDLIHQGTVQLMEMNIYKLLADIYDQSNWGGIFSHPEVRIGLSLKLLHNLRVTLDKSILRPIIRDIEDLLNDSDYLESTGDSELRAKCLRDELDFIHRYIDIDDTITLNTEQSPRTIGSNSSTGRNSNSRANQADACVIQ